jgi:hypothetical protein
MGPGAPWMAFFVSSCGWAILAILAILNLPTYQLTKLPTLSMSLRTSLNPLSKQNRKRTERLNLLNQVLEHGTEDDYLELLVGWGVPARNLEGLLNEFRHHRRTKRRLLL